MPGSVSRSSPSLLLSRPRSDAIPSRLRAWEIEMGRANDAAHQGPAAVARSRCRHALALARELLQDPPAGHEEDCVAALVVSRHNLADLESEAGRIDASAEQLCCAHEELMALVLARDVGAPLQQAALRHSRETHAGLLRHLGTHGSHPAITRALKAGCAALAVGTPH